jgi:hypothetical protein
MKDNLERYIIDNRERFNDAEPNPLLWLEIEKKLPATRKKSRVVKMKRVLAIAASFIVILATGMIIGANLNNNSSVNSMTDEQIAEFQEAEHFFQKQVNVKMNELKEYKLEEDVENDLNQLDAVYSEMKAELMTSSNKDNSAIIKAMIDNYRIRIEMLEKILNNVNHKSNSYEEENISI